jgi:hypothetical protein
MFVHQDKYTKDLLKKFNMGEAKSLLMPMSTMTALEEDKEGEAMDQKEYRSMIGSLLYLTAMRPDIQFVVYLCVHFQSSLHMSHRQAIKRIMRYLHFTPEFILWFSASSLSLLGIFDVDYVGCHIEKKSTLGTCRFIGSFLVS